MSSKFIVSALLIVSMSIYANAIAAEPPITAIAFSPDGKTVVACSQVGIQIFNWPDLKMQRVIKTDMDNLLYIKFSPNGSTLAVGGGFPAKAGVIEIYSWPNLKMIKKLEVHDDSVRSLAWFGGNKLFSGSIDRTIKLHTIDGKGSSKYVKRFLGHSRSVESICLLRGEKTLLSGSLDQSIRVWDTESGKLVRNMNQHTQGVHSLAVRPGEAALPMVASAAADRTVRFWEPTIGRMVRYIRLQSEPLSIAWLNDNRSIAAACEDGKVRIVDADEVKLIQTIDALDGWAYSISVHPDDGSLAVGGSDGVIKRLLLEIVGRKTQN